jgi:hypothetical protein
MLMLRAYRHRSFSLLWAGQTVSRVGDFLYQVALAWWVLEHTGSAAAMSAVLIMQERVPADKLGRVSSIDLLGSSVLIPVGFAAGGWATDQFGAPLVFLMGGGITSFVALLALLHPAIRRLD